ncbi:hypothetical protein QUF64_06610 [Anaerolineales bacterium HSG6]|nr:hypothetical protein [Anaerolineales bacterium HSG6]
MIITKEHLKAEIDKVPEQYLEVLYRIIRALIDPLEQVTRSHQQSSEMVEAVVNDTQATPKNSAKIESDIEPFQGEDDKTETWRDDMKQLMHDIRQDHPFMKLSREEILEKLRQTREEVYDELYGDRYAS